MEKEKSFFDMVEAEKSNSPMKALKENHTAEKALALAKGECNTADEMQELEKAAEGVENIIKSYDSIYAARNALLAYGCNQVYNNRRTAALSYLSRRLPSVEFKIYLKEIISRFSVVKNDDGTFITKSNARALKYNAVNKRFYMPKQAKSLLAGMERINGWKEALLRPYGSDKFKHAEKGQGQFDIIIEHAARSLFKALVKKSKDSGGSRISKEYVSSLEELAKVIFADSDDNQDFDDVMAVLANYIK